MKRSQPFARVICMLTLANCKACGDPNRTSYDDNNAETDACYQPGAKMTLSRRGSAVVL